MTIKAFNWQLATGNWQLATGNWQLAPGNWQLATGNVPVFGIVAQRARLSSSYQMIQS